MTDKRTAAQARGPAQKDPDDWVTGDEPMTGAQRSYLKTLSAEAKVDFDATLTKADASRRIEELKRLTGRSGEGAVTPTMPRIPRADEEDGAPVNELDLDGDGARNE